MRAAFVPAFLVAFAAALPAHAAEKSALLESTYVERGYTALSFRGTKVLDESVSEAGFLWSWAAHQRLNLGFGASGILSEPKLESQEAPGLKRKLSLYTVGFRGEVPVFTYEVVSFSLNFDVGGGHVGYRGSLTDSSDGDYVGDTFSYGGAGASTYLHVTDELEAGLSFDYRRAGAVDLAGVEAGDISGAGVALSLRRWF